MVFMKMNFIFYGLIVGQMETILKQTSTFHQIFIKFVFLWYKLLLIKHNAWKFTFFERGGHISDILCYLKDSAVEELYELSDIGLCFLYICNLLKWTCFMSLFCPYRKDSETTSTAGMDRYHRIFEIPETWWAHYW